MGRVGSGGICSLYQHRHRQRCAAYAHIRRAMGSESRLCGWWCGKRWAAAAVNRRADRDLACGDRATPPRVAPPASWPLQPRRSMRCMCMCGCVDVWMCGCVHECMYACVPASSTSQVNEVYVHARMCACVHVCMCTCVHVCKCAGLFNLTWLDMA